MDLFSASEIVENDEEEIDMFAELGVINTQQNSVAAVHSMQNNSAHMDLLAAFMEDDEVPEPQQEDGFVFVTESKPIVEIEPMAQKQVVQSMPAIPEETMTI